jgi:hypothetical protein
MLPASVIGESHDRRPLYFLLTCAKRVDTIDFLAEFLAADTSLVRALEYDQCPDGALHLVLECLDVPWGWARSIFCV